MKTEGINLSGRRVLIVEDEALVGMYLADILESNGMKVVDIAETSEEALDAAKGLDFDVAFFDINLLGKTSYTAAEIVADRGIPVVFVSGYVNVVPPLRLAHAPVLIKPFEPARVATAIQSALAPPALC